MVGFGINAQKGTANIVSTTPISGVTATNATIAKRMMRAIIASGCKKKVSVPATRPKKSIRFPRPRFAVAYFAMTSSESPKQFWKSHLPDALLVIALANESLENESGKEIMRIAIPTMRWSTGAVSSAGKMSFTKYTTQV